MHILHAGRENDLSLGTCPSGRLRTGGVGVYGRLLYMASVPAPGLKSPLPTYSVHPLLPSEAIWSQVLRIQYVYSSLAAVDSEEGLAYKTRSTVERDRIYKNGGRYPVRNRDRIR